MEILRLSVTLDGVRPAVTRVLDVPRDLPLDRLHLALQAAFGWENTRLHEFVAGETRWHPPEAEETGPLTAGATLDDLVDTAGQSPIRYIYDFGDDWCHRIEVAHSGTPQPGTAYPRLVEVHGRCPPENVGGPAGYAAFLDALGDPADPEHDEVTAWVGGDFDPEVPDSAALHAAVAALARRWKGAA